jgi:hypothetical protein
MFAGKHWEELTDKQVMCYRQCIYFLSMKALIYFIPAFMLASIREVTRSEHGWDVTEHTLTAIDRFASEGDAETGEPNPQQRLAIRRYLETLLQFCSTEECHTQVVTCIGKLKRVWDSSNGLTG